MKSFKPQKSDYCDDGKQIQLVSEIDLGDQPANTTLTFQIEVRNEALPKKIIPQFSCNACLQYLTSKPSERKNYTYLVFRFFSANHSDTKRFVTQTIWINTDQVFATNQIRIMGHVLPKAT